VGLDVFIFNISMYISGHLALLKNDITKLQEYSKNPNVLQEKIYELIKRHSQLLKLAKMLDQAISEILIIELIMNCGIILMLGK
jgi:hypothetical protein